MIWIEFAERDGTRTMMNLTGSSIVSYHADTDWTIVETLRSAFPAKYIKGNHLSEIKKIINNNKDGVFRIGE